MAYIYQIINTINGKMYIGKTLASVEQRWKEHQRDSKKEKCKNRPLYRAINKYGINNFQIKTIEEVPPEIVNEREIYWIETLGTYKNGYNATHGGDGKAYADYDLIYSLWNMGKTNKEIHCITGYDTATIKNALNNKNVSEKERQERKLQVINRCVAMLDKDTSEILRIFPSLTAAFIFLNKRHNGHIAAVCNGKRKTAYGYGWKYIN